MSIEYIRYLEGRLGESERRIAELEGMIELTPQRTEALREANTQETRPYPKMRLTVSMSQDIVNRVSEMLRNGQKMTVKQILYELALGEQLNQSQLQSIIYREVKRGRYHEAGRTGFNELVIKLGDAAGHEEGVSLHSE